MQASQCRCSCQHWMVGVRAPAPEAYSGVAAASGRAAPYYIPPLAAPPCCHLDKTEEQLGIPLLVSCLVCRRRGASANLCRRRHGSSGGSSVRLRSATSRLTPLEHARTLKPRHTLSPYKRTFQLPRLWLLRLPQRADGARRDPHKVASLRSKSRHDADVGELASVQPDAAQNKRPPQRLLVCRGLHGAGQGWWWNVCAGQSGWCGLTQGNGSQGIERRRRQRHSGGATAHLWQGCRLVAAC